MNLQNVRILARMFDGTLRIALRYGDQPGWLWAVASISEQQFNGDVIIQIPENERLPGTDAEFRDILKAQ